jgi:protein-L-isoaspartate(D-aspartate) O-methyltransferase
MPVASPGFRGCRVMADFTARRHRMVDTQLVARGVRHPAVLRAMATVPRERFVSALDAADPYEDSALPIGQAQTISQPYVVALMLEALDPEPTDRVLEIGTGSGYAAAVLAEVVAEVYTIERLASLAEAARARLAELGYRNVHVREGDGTLGWPEHAPYDGIVVAAGGPEVPAPLLPQLKPGAHLVVPVGSSPRSQELVRVTRHTADAYTTDTLGPVAFVPLIGEAGWPRGIEPPGRGQ